MPPGCVLSTAVFAFNLLVLLFSRRLILLFTKSRDEAAYDRRLRNLRALNVIAFLLYFVSVINPMAAARIGESIFVLISAYLSNFGLKSWTLHRFGRTKDLDGENVLVESYQSEMAGLLVLLVVVIAGFLFLINIWGLTDWLKATSVLGGLLILTYSTKDVWAPENIHGLILLYNADVDAGSVVRVPELNLLAVVKQITLTQTSLRDLRQRHLILIPNSRFRSAKIEVLSNATSKGLVDFIDFNLGYGLNSQDVEDFLTRVWEKAVALEPAIHPDGKPQVRLVANGDHAVTWRLFYTVRNVYKMLAVGFAINRVAYDLSLEEGIGLNTPLTHQVLDIPAPQLLESSAD